jgi:hypothetical protein
VLNVEKPARYTDRRQEMTRKEILLFQLREIRNEFADALADLTQEQLTAKAIGDHNPIGWIVCHCISNFDFFIHERQTNKSIVADYEDYGIYTRYAWKPPTEENPPPDLTRAVNALDKVCEICIELIESLDEEALSNPAPYWHNENFESTTGNCIRVINHSNAHLRQIWMVRGALGDTDHWPVQTLRKRPNKERGRFYVPDRERILAVRARRKSA